MEELKAAVAKLLDDLRKISHGHAPSDQVRWARLRVWTDRAIQTLGGFGLHAEAYRIKAPTVHSYGDEFSRLRHVTDQHDALLVSIKEDLGANPEYWQQRLNQQIEAAPVKPAQPALTVGEVYVVHGRNLRVRNEMHNFLRAIGLKPREWSAARMATGKAMPYIDEVLQQAFSPAQAIIVLMTPDDEARLKAEFLNDGDQAYERELTPQPRQNVLFEAGLAMGSFRNRTIFVQLGKVRDFSDISGIHVVRMDNTPEKRQELAERLKTIGCPVALSGNGWLQAGDFEVTELSRA